MSNHWQWLRNRAPGICCMSFIAGAMIVFSPVYAQTALSAPPSQPNQTKQSAASESARHQGREVLHQISQVFEHAAEVIKPSVVAILSESTVTVRSPFSGGPLEQFFGDQFMQRFGLTPEQQKRTVHALGSGVIASSDGYILTNNHVVDGANQLTVVLPDGNRKPAKIIGTDPATDLALIKVDAHGLDAAKFGDSDKLKIGQWVIAVGNPFGLLNTTTAGIVSALGRSHVNVNSYEDFIQTDAAINPGNSGGPLANLDGEVVGINAEISTPSGGSVGLGFAIPINLAKNVMRQLKANGKVVRGFLGVVLQKLTPTLADALGVDKKVEGVLIGDVQQDSPADKAGIHQGDVITAFDGNPVDNVVTLRNRVAGTAPGTSATLTVLRNGKTLNLPVTLGQRPSQDSARAESSGGTATPAKLGFTVQTLTQQLANQLGYQGEEGAVITQVQPGSGAAKVGLRRGDLIKSVDRQPIQSAEQFKQRLQRVQSGSTVALLVQRGSHSFFVAFELP